MLHSDDLKFFQVVSGAVSLAAAARALDASPSAVTQRLLSLERRVGVRLLNRSSRRLALTAEGRFLDERGAGMLADMDGIIDVLSRCGSRPIVASCVPRPVMSPEAVAPGCPAICATTPAR